MSVLLAVDMRIDLDPVRRRQQRIDQRFDVIGPAVTTS